MTLGNLSTAAQEGLRLWSIAVWGDGLILDNQGHTPVVWAWTCFLLRESEDRPEWFPRGKWATIQAIETALLEEARDELGERNRKP